MGKRDLIGVVVGLPAARGRLLTTGGVALSARARTIGDWSMVWLRDYAPPAPSSQHSCCDAFGTFRHRRAHCGRLELYEPHQARPALPIERDSLRTSSRTSSATLMEAPPSNAVSHASQRGMSDRIRLRSADGEQMRSTYNATCLETAGFRSLSHPPSP